MPPDEPSEDDTERDGVLSYAAEWHALAIGIAHGLKRVKKPPDSNPDIKAEPHYYHGGYVVGWTAKALAASASAVAVASQMGLI